MAQFSLAESSGIGPVSSRAKSHTTSVTACRETREDLLKTLNGGSGFTFHIPSSATSAALVDNPPLSRPLDRNGSLCFLFGNNNCSKGVGVKSTSIKAELKQASDSATLCFHSDKQGQTEGLFRSPAVRLIADADIMGMIATRLAGCSSSGTAASGAVMS